MTTWRERIAEAEARTRGWRRLLPRRAFTLEDVQRMVSADTCLMGETAERFGLHVWDLANALNDRDGIGWIAPLDAIHADSPSRVGRLLDTIEDRALALKREQSGASSEATNS